MPAFPDYSKVFSHECYQNDIPVDIIRRYGRISADETYTIYKGVTTEHVVHRENGYGKANKMIFETICLQDSLYTLELRDAYFINSSLSKSEQG